MIGLPKAADARRWRPRALTLKKKAEELLSLMLAEEKDGEGPSDFADNVLCECEDLVEMLDRAIRYGRK